MKMLYIAGLLVVLSAVSAHAQLSWEQVGPDGGIVTALACEGSSVYAGGLNGTIHHSANHAGNWSRRNLPHTTRSVGGITIGADAVLAYTFSTLYRSTDEGMHWTEVSVDTGTMNFSAITATPQYTYVSTSAGIYRSTDDGITWTKLPTQLRSVQELHATGATVLAGPGVIGVFVSTDAGMTWKMADETFASGISDITSDGGGGLYIVSNARGIWRSTDNGTTWQPTAMNSPYIFTIACDGPILYANHSVLDGIYVSVDTGTTSRMMMLPDAVTDIQAVDGHAYAATVHGVYHSSDSGNTWIRASEGMRSASVSSIVIQGTTLLALNAGELYRSTDDGHTWPDRITPGISDNIVSVAVEDNQKLYVGNYGGLYSTTDAGTGWEADINTDYDPIVGIVLHPSAFVAATNLGIFYRSTDGGKQWTSVTTNGLPNSAIIGALGTHRSHLFAGLASNGVITSTNDGDT